MRRVVLASVIALVACGHRDSPPTSAGSSSAGTASAGSSSAAAASGGSSSAAAPSFTVTYWSQLEGGTASQPESVTVRSTGEIEWSGGGPTQHKTVPPAALAKLRALLAAPDLPTWQVATPAPVGEGRTTRLDIDGAVSLHLYGGMLPPAADPLVDELWRLTQ